MVLVIDDPYSGNIFGRFGAGIGKGLSEQVPKEIERTRLASGLKKLEQEKDLDPMQFFTRALSIPGITPQAIETLGKLAKQRMQGEALKGFGGRGEGTKFPTLSNKENGNERGEAPSITTRTPIEATLKPYIPLAPQEINAQASELYEQNPAFFQHEPQKAIDFVVNQDAREQARNIALQGQRANEQNVQNTIVSALRNQSQNLGTQVPSNVYSQVEDKAINSVRSKEDGGEGLTEQEAMKKYGNQLDGISRDYSAVGALGSAGILLKKPSTTVGSIKSLQSKFAERNDLENFAQELISRNKLSPGYAFSLAYPVSSSKELSHAMQNVPALYKKIEPSKALVPSLIQKGLQAFNAPKIEKSTVDVSKKIAPLLGKNGSPLSVAEDLKNKGYDPETWMNYLREHRKELDLTESQARQLDIALPASPNLNDLWLQTFTGKNQARTR